MYAVSNPDKVENLVCYTSNFTNKSIESVKTIHEKYGHALIQRLNSFIPSGISKAEQDKFKCKACVLAKITKQPFKSES
jgi:hypothetical protein